MPFFRKEGASRNVSSTQSGPMTRHNSLKIQTYCDADASCAPGSGRSRSGILTLLVDVPRIELL